MAATEEQTRAPDGPSPQATLAAEAARRTKAGASAIAAALLTLAGALLVLSPTDDFPSVRLLESLSVKLGLVPAPQPDLVARKVLFFDDNILQIAAVQIVPALGMAFAGVALAFLFQSTRARNPEVSKIAVIAAISGAVLVVVAAFVTSISLAINVADFAGAQNQSEQAARDVLESPFTSTAAYLVQLGTFSVGLGFMLTALNAMRVGLLTRFMGVLGMIVGVLFLIPLEAQLPLVKIFWLGALGALLLDRWPGERPPAWSTGEAQPWPTQQQLREQRKGTQAEGKQADGSRNGRAAAEEPERRSWRQRAEPPETPAPERPASKPHPSSKKKKKRKRH